MYHPGTIPLPPVVFPPNPSAGARIGNNERARASNGYTWVEDLANTLGAKLVNVRHCQLVLLFFYLKLFPVILVQYAVGGAVTDLSVWNSTKNGPVSS